MAKLGSWILIAFIILALCAELEASKKSHSKRSPSTTKNPTRSARSARSTTRAKPNLSLFDLVTQFLKKFTDVNNGLSEIEKLVLEAYAKFNQKLQHDQQEINELITWYKLVEVFMKANKKNNDIMLIDLKSISNTDTSTLSILQKMMPQSSINQENRVMEVSLNDYQHNVPLVSMKSTQLLEKLRKLAEEENDPEMRHKLSTLHLIQDHIRKDFLNEKHSMPQTQENPGDTQKIQHNLPTLEQPVTQQQTQIPTIIHQNEMLAQLGQLNSNNVPGHIAMLQELPFFRQNPLGF